MEWDSSIGNFLIFLIVLSAILFLYAIIFCIYTHYENNRQRQQQPSIVVTYTPIVMDYV